MNEVAGHISVEVAYAEPEKQRIVPVVVPEGTTAIEAVHLSGICNEFDSLAGRDSFDLGIFSRKCDADQRLEQGDRVEIYRPLTIDPKEARRLKAEVAARRKAERKA